MGARRRKRVAAFAVAPIAVAIVAFLALTGTASANNVTSITADCNFVTVHFADFPSGGTMVHIAAQVDGQSPITTDVLVTNSTTQAQLDISAATALLFGATANVDVDVTWVLTTSHHVHETITVTCGSATTTTSTTESTTTSSTSTSTTSSTSTTTTEPATTSTTVETQTTFAVTTTTIPGTTTSVGVLGTTIPTGGSTTTTVVAGTTSTLPFTGSSPLAAVVGTATLACGAAFASARRRRARG